MYKEVEYLKFGSLTAREVLAKIGNREAFVIVVDAFPGRDRCVLEHDGNGRLIARSPIGANDSCVHAITRLDVAQKIVRRWFAQINEALTEGA